MRVGTPKKRLTRFAKECNDASERAHRVKYDSCRIRLNSLLTERSVVAYAVVHAVAESGIVLLFPNLQPMLFNDNALKISSLKPSTLPDTKLNAVRVQWKQRIYDLSQQITKQLSTDCREVELIQQQYSVLMKSSDWKKLFHAVTIDDRETVSKAISELLRQNDCLTDSAEDLTSEGEILRSGKHFCEYAATFSTAFLVKVQLAAKTIYSRPHIQLFHLSRKTCICVEHNTSVVDSFSKPASVKATVSKYENIGHYQKLWLPVLSAEAAYSAVTNGDSVIICNVDIRWKHGTSKTTGTFDISAQFCDERCITFPVDEEPAMDDSDVKGYLCVRYSDCLKQVVKKRSAVDTFEGVLGIDKPFTWVGHCVVAHVVSSLDNSYYVVHLRLKQSSCTFPEQLRSKATIEWIPKLTPDR